MYLNRNAILAIDDIQTETLEVPGWGGSVIVRGMTGKQRDEFEQFITQGKANGKINNSNIRARLVSMCLVDENNDFLFTPKDIDALGQKNAIALDAIFDVGMKLSGIRDGEAGEVEENFPLDHSGNSTSP